MFRVDPQSRGRALTSRPDGMGHETYDILQVTKPHPYWILQASRTQGPCEPSWGYRSQFANVLSAIEVASETIWMQATLYIVLPEQLTPSRRIVTSAATEIWLCDIDSKNAELCFEVITESAGNHFINATGSRAQKAKRTDLLWPPSLKEG